MGEKNAGQRWRSQERLIRFTAYTDSLIAPPQTWLSPTATPSHPAMRSFSSFMSQKEAWSKMKGYISQNPRPQRARGARALLPFKAPAIVWASIQAYCCAEISRAPFRSRGMRRTPLLFGVHICGCIDAWPRLPSPLAVALCPFPKAQYDFFFPHPLCVVHFLRTLAGQHSFSFLSPSFVLLLSFGVYAYCFSEHLIIHMVIF